MDFTMTFPASDGRLIGETEAEAVSLNFMDLRSRPGLSLLIFAADTKGGLLARLEMDADEALRLAETLRATALTNMARHARRAVGRD